jgi:hypothetical protein
LEAEVDFAELGRERGELVAVAAAVVVVAADPDDNGRDAAFSLALEDEGTGALDSFGGW